MISANEFANTIQEDQAETSNFRMATVTQVSSGNAYLTFYGESTQRTKSYKHLASYTSGKFLMILSERNLVATTIT